MHVVFCFSVSPLWDLYLLLIPCWPLVLLWARLALLETTTPPPSPPSSDFKHSCCENLKVPSSKTSSQEAECNGSTTWFGWYAWSIVCLLLLALAGDVETNPGPGNIPGPGIISQGRVISQDQVITGVVKAKNMH